MRDRTHLIYSPPSCGETTLMLDDAKTASVKISETNQYRAATQLAAHRSND
jgi:stage III sporulation protein SpoIIIAA